MAHEKTLSVISILPVVHVLLFPFLITASKVPAIIVFGDSTVDAGNNNQIPTILKSNFRPYGRDFYGGKPTGRFCDGRLATDFVAEAFGLTPVVPAYLDPEYGIKDFATAVCFASAGTGLDNATSHVLSVIPLWKEVEYFKEYRKKLARYMGKEKAYWTLNEALYIVSIGTNDFLENYYLQVTGRSSEFTIGEFEDFLIGIAGKFLTEIYQLGARKISFTGLPPMGCLPLERTTNIFFGGGCVEEYNEAARSYNTKLQEMIHRLRMKLPGIRLVYGQVYDHFLEIIQNPSLYGFENVELGCCASGMFEMGYLCDEWNPYTCPDANDYVFWDAFHPTQKMNWILANRSLHTGLAQFF